MAPINQLYASLKENKIYRSVEDVLIFAVLLMGFHYLYIFWGNSGFWPVGEMVDRFFNWGSRVLFHHSLQVIDALGLTYTTEGQTFFITSKHGTQGWLEVAPGCTSLKQWMHWLFLMVLFPGPLKHKAWYIPAGILVIYLVSIVRISGLAVALTYQPLQFDFYHDYIFKTMFYVSIFTMWVIWVEVFKKKSP